MNPRLPFRRNADGYIAYPDGEQYPDRRIEITKNTSSGHTPWGWFAVYDTAKGSGVAATQQQAADAARSAWPGLQERAAENAVKAAEEAALRDLVQRMARTGDVPLSEFNIEGSSTERLTHIIWLLTYGGLGSIDGPAKPLVEACSVELGRRRGVKPAV